MDKKRKMTAAESDTDAAVEVQKKKRRWHVALGDMLRSQIDSERAVPRGALRLFADLSAVAIGFLFAGCHLIFGSYPLAIALVAVLPQSVWLALLGAVIGSLVLGRVGVIYGMICILVVFLRVVISGGDKHNASDGTASGNTLFSENVALRMSSATIGGFVAAVYELLLTGLTLDGILTASIGSTSGKSSVASGYARFSGSYTVSMPVEETTAWYYTFGAGYLSLKTSTMNASKGLVTYAGALPNGIAVSGSAYLGVDPDDPDYAILPVYTRSSCKLSNGSKKYAAKDDLAAVLRIQANGESLYDNSETVRVVLAPKGVSSLWKRTTSAADNALEATMNVYGGFYAPGNEIPDWLSLFGLGTEDDLVATVDGEEVQATWKFSEATGVITGKAKTTIDRRTVIASFKGVVTPGWLDCGCGDDDQTVRPFATGTFFYSSRVNGFSTPASLEFNLVAP